MWQLSEAIDGHGRGVPGPRHPGRSAATSASTTRAGAATSIPRRSSVSSASIDDLRRRPPGVRLVDGHRLVVVGPPVDAEPGRIPPRRRPRLRPTRHAAGPRPRRGGRHRRPRARPRRRRRRERRPRRRRRRCARRPRRDGRRRRRRVPGGAGCTPSPSCSASRRDGSSCASPPRRWPAWSRRPRRRTSACVRMGLAGGDRLVVKDVLDLPLAEVTATWRDRLPGALGHGTTQS